MQTCDKEGAAALCCDLVFNTDSLERCWGELQSRDVLRQFACAAVARKHRLDLQETVSFPKTTYKGTLPPPRQRIRVTHEARIELVGAAAGTEARTPAATGKGPNTAAVHPTKASSSLAEYLVWDGVFATPADAGAYCLSIAQGQEPQGSLATQAITFCFQQGKTANPPHGSPWIASWIGSCRSDNSRNNERIIHVGAVENCTLLCKRSSSSSTETNKRGGLKKAFLVAKKPAAASSSTALRSQQTEARSNNPAPHLLEGRVYVLQLVLPRTTAAVRASAATYCTRCRGQTQRCCCSDESLAWEFKCTYTIKISDLELVVLPLRGALWGIERNNTGSLQGCSLAFPLRLRSKAAFALVCAYSCCEEAKAWLQQLEQHRFPTKEDPVATLQRAQNTAEDAMSAGTAFLLTICLFVDTTAEVALARICPAAAAAAAEAAAVEVVDKAAAEADENEMSTRLPVEIDESSSSDEPCNGILVSSDDDVTT